MRGLMKLAIKLAPMKRNSFMTFRYFYSTIRLCQSLKPSSQSTIGTIAEDGTVGAITPSEKNPMFNPRKNIKAESSRIDQAKEQNTEPSNTKFLKVMMTEERASYEVSYSKVTKEDAEQRLGFRLDEFEEQAIPISQMLMEANPKNDGLGKEQLLQIKHKVYERIAEFIVCEGIPTDSTDDFKEENINDLVYTIISPVIAACRLELGRKLRLKREKKITAVDGKYGGIQEFVTVDLIGVGTTKFVFVVEAKRSTLGHAKIQCLLAMMDMAAINDGGVVYGFITTGQQWQMVRYANKHFTQTDTFEVLFHTMRQDKERWVRESSVVIDALHAALVSGGGDQD